ncbi:hypothetical protein COLO4_28236 [Corchorus olitorius]|uniref:Uncharacterized protein n=1 Tax=Corchorus olitorius TaxID=93759 RepID=A0A1R3HMF5_9ROSI|nr:hypothetical protein COLO4_28236 [Corchorus olitorius]
MAQRGAVNSSVFKRLTVCAPFRGMISTLV